MAEIYLPGGNDVVGLVEQLQDASTTLTLTLRSREQDRNKSAIWGQLDLTCVWTECSADGRPGGGGAAY